MAGGADCLEFRDFGISRFAIQKLKSGAAFCRRTAAIARFLAFEPHELLDHIREIIHPRYMRLEEEFWRAALGVGMGTRQIGSTSRALY